MVFIQLDGLAHAGRGAAQRFAVKEIARQLCCLKEGFEFTEVADEERNLSFISEVLRRLCAEGCYALFVLDRFEMFAPKHVKQTLLYTLLNWVHYPGIQAGLLGVSAAFNAAEALEKRVKSRFSHRTVHLEDLRGEEALAGTLAACLRVDPSDLPTQQQQAGAPGLTMEAVARYNDSVAAAVSSASVRASLSSQARHKAAPHLEERCDPALLAQYAGRAVERMAEAGVACLRPQDVVEVRLERGMQRAGKQLQCATLSISPAGDAGGLPAAAVGPALPPIPAGLVSDPPGQHEPPG